MASDTYSPFSFDNLSAPPTPGVFTLPESMTLPAGFPRDEINQRPATLPLLESELAEIKTRLGTPAEKPGDQERSRTVRHEMNNLWCVRALIEMEREAQLAEGAGPASKDGTPASGG